MASSPEARLAELGIELPLPAAPPFTPRLKPVVVHGGLAYLSGNGDLGCLGRVGDDIDIEQAAGAARTTAHLMCRSLRDELGSLDRVERWLKALVFVRSAPGFGGSPWWQMDSRTRSQSCGGEDRGVCARSAIGVAELPNGLAVEIEALVALA